MEIWKEIEGYEGYYLISTFGRIKSQSRKIYNDGTYKTYEQARIKRDELLKELNIQT